MRQSLTIFLLAQALLAATAFSWGCGQQVGAPGSAPGSATQSGRDGGSPLVSLIERMATAPQEVKFQGRRIVEADLFDGQTWRRLVVEERILANGEGGFAIEPLHILEPLLSPVHEEMAINLQDLRQGLHFRYRDFLVRNLDLFFRHYTVLDTGTLTPVAGRSCAEWLVEKVSTSDRRFRVWVDVENALVLRAIEENQDGHVLSKMEFLDLDLDPVIDPGQMFVPRNAEVPLDLNQDGEGGLGFDPISPRTWPAGFELLEKTRVTEPPGSPEAGTRWVKFTYSDGVDQIFFLHGGPHVPALSLKSGWPLEPDKVTWLKATPWIVAQGNVRGQRVLAMGKVSENELFRMLDSAFP